MHRRLASSVAVVELASGIGMAVAPAKLARSVAGAESAAPPGLVRVLGARTALQGALIWSFASRRALRLGAAADALHCATMVVAAATSPANRRSAAVSAAFACTTAAVSLVAST